MAEALGDALLSLRTDDSELVKGLDAARRKVDKAMGALAAAQARATTENTKAKAAYKAGEITLEAYNKTLLKTKAGLQVFEQGHREAQKELTKFQAAGSGVVQSTSAQRHGMQQLSMQLNDVATMYALGARPMQIFASQGGQVIQAMTLMSQGGKGLVGFLAGPWGMAITTATIVLVPFVSQLFEAERAAKLAEEGADGLARAQSALGNVFDMVSGKLNTQNQLLILNARLTAINLREEARQKERAFDATVKDARLPSVWSALRSNMGPKQAGANSAAVRALLVGVKNGAITSDQALQFSKGLDLRGTGLSVEQIRQAIVDQEVAKVNNQAATLIDQSLDSGQLAGEFIQPGPKGRQSPKTPKGPDAAKIEGRFNDELASLTDRTLSAMERQATNAEDEAEFRLRGVELARVRTLADIKANADYSKVQKERLSQQVEELAEWERKGIELDKQARIEREQAGLAQDRHQAAVEDLRLQEQMAGTQEERKQLALKLFDLEERYQRSLLQSTIASETAEEADKERARLALARLDESAGRRRAGVTQANETEVERYLRHLDKTEAQIGEAMDGVAIDGLERLNDGLTDAIMGAESLGDVFHSVANQIIADLLRIAIQQTIIRPLAEALFGGSGSGGGGLGGLFASLFAGGFATGGLIPAGQIGIAGERGPEPVVGTSQGARVLPHSSLWRGGGLAGGGVTFDMRGAVTRDEHLREMREIARQITAGGIAQYDDGLWPRIQKKGAQFG